MPDPASFRQVMQDLDKARAVLEQTHANAPPSAEKDMLGQVLQSMKARRAEAEEAFPKAVDAIQQDLKETQQQLDRLKQEHAKAQAKVQEAQAKAERAAKKAAEAAAKMPEPPHADLGLGATLKHELLSLLPTHGTDGDVPKRTEIWQDWGEARDQDED